MRGAAYRGFFLVSDNSNKLAVPTDDTFTEYDESTRSINTIDIYTGEVIHSAPYDPSEVHDKKRLQIPYSKELSDIIFQLLLDGRPLQEIVSMPGMPSLRQLTLWRTRHEEFDEIFTKARSMRAEITYDEIREVSGREGGLTREEVQEKKLYVDSLKWLVERGDREKFGAGKADAGAANIIVQVNTGIERDAPIEVVSPGDKASD